MQVYRATYLPTWWNGRPSDRHTLQSTHLAYSAMCTEYEPRYNIAKLQASMQASRYLRAAEPALQD